MRFWNSQKVFSVPIFTPDQEKIPFARVNHNKYMVTDQAAYIGECQVSDAVGISDKFFSRNF